MNPRERERKFTSSFLRKIRKPIVERKRRNRINKSLDDLKEILLENMKRNGNTQVAKLDKADILEMTVQHLRLIQQQQLSVAMATSTSCLQQYRQGFAECAQEAVRYMTTSGSYAGLLTSSIDGHLSSLLSRDVENQPNILRCSSQPMSSSETISSSETMYSSDAMCSSETEFSIKSECETPKRKCRSASPQACVSKRLQFSPLSRNVMGRQLCGRLSAGSSSVNTDNRNNNAVLMIPPRLPVNADDASPQRNVWRPF